MKKKSGASKWIVRIAFVLGFLLLCYPLVSGIIQARYQSRAIATYDDGVEGTSEEDLKGILEDARYYNSMLYQSQGASLGNLDTTVLSEESYDNLLNQAGTGVMGSIEIPKIDVDLPIYHGTSNEVLEVGVGHQEGTSLPVGGENTRCVLTGHRGLPGSKLFTRLDEIVEGDFFFVNVLGETLAYQVTNIEVVEPDSVDVMMIEAGKDQVSLVTCTPYGINSHRLVVTGDRVEYQEATYDSISEAVPSVRELFFTAAPFILLLIAVIFKIVDWRKGKKHETKEQ